MLMRERYAAMMDGQVQRRRSHSWSCSPSPPLNGRCGKVGRSSDL